MSEHDNTIDVISILRKPGDPISNVASAAERIDPASLPVVSRLLTRFSDGHRTYAHSAIAKSPEVLPSVVTLFHADGSGHHLNCPSEPIRFGPDSAPLLTAFLRWFLADQPCYGLIYHTSTWALHARAPVSQDALAPFLDHVKKGFDPATYPGVSRAFNSMFFISVEGYPCVSLSTTIVDHTSPLAIPLRTDKITLRAHPSDPNASTLKIRSFLTPLAPLLLPFSLSSPPPPSSSHLPSPCGLPSL